MHACIITGGNLRYVLNNLCCVLSLKGGGVSGTHGNPLPTPLVFQFLHVISRIVSIGGGVGGGCGCGAEGGVKHSFGLKDHCCAFRK